MNVVAWRHVSSLLGEKIAGLLHTVGLHERRCVACLTPFDPGSEKNFGDAVSFLMLCPACRAKIVRREAGFCPYCGEPSAFADAPCTPCGACLRKLPPWREFLFFGIHEGLLRDLILRGKFGADMSALRFLGELLADRCSEYYEAAPLPNAIVPMPLHVRRLRERGYNQCREMARYLSWRLGLPVRNDLLLRSEATVAQASLDREHRLSMGQPFTAGEAVQDMRILLLDDVCTTGTTLTRAVECLMDGGAASVDVVVVARASRHSPPESRYRP